MSEVALGVVGVSHHTADLSLREQCKIKNADEKIKFLLASGICKEAVYLSTCNRDELYVSFPKNESEAFLKENVLETFFSENGCQEKFYCYVGERAVAHAFSVASGVDSALLGETQIAGQFKAAFRESLEKKYAGHYLGRLYSRALFTARRARTVTSISARPLSVGSIALGLSKKIFGDLASKKLLVFGTGETAKLVITFLRDAGLSDISLCSSDVARGTACAEKYNAKVLERSAVERDIGSFDIIIGATSVEAGAHVLSVLAVSELKKNPKLRLILDLGVPRNFSQSISTAENVFFSDIDDIASIIAENLRERKKEAVKVSAIIEEEAEKFGWWMSCQTLNPLLRELGQNVGANMSLFSDVNIWKSMKLFRRGLSSKERVEEALKDYLRINLPK